MFLQPEERYQAGESFVHRLDPRTKLLVTLGLIVSISLLPFGRWAFYALTLLVLLAISQVAKIGATRLLRSSFVALPFALAALALPLTVPGQAIAYVPLVQWAITLEGIERAASIIIKSWLSVQMSILLVMTTPLPDLLWALQSLRVPPVLVAIVSFMYRYLYVLADEAGRLLRARAARSAARLGQRAGNTLLWRGRAAGYMVGSLMMRSSERSERIYHAMAARGYRGELKNFATRRFTLRDGVVLGCAGVVMLALVIFGRYGGGS
jgi:cobalt/nickel transport system permease protein